MFFVKPDTQIDSAYHWDELLLLSAIQNIADEVYIFQHDSASAHHACQTVVRIKKALLLTWPPNSRALIRFVTAFAEWCRNESIKRQYRTV